MAPEERMQYIHASKEKTTYENSGLIWGCFFSKAAGYVPSCDALAASCSLQRLHTAKNGGPRRREKYIKPETNDREHSTTEY